MHSNRLIVINLNQNNSLRTCLLPKIRDNRTLMDKLDWVQLSLTNLHNLKDSNSRKTFYQANPRTIKWWIKCNSNNRFNWIQNKWKRQKSWLFKKWDNSREIGSMLMIRIELASFKTYWRRLGWMKIRLYNSKPNKKSKLSSKKLPMLVQAQEFLVPQTSRTNNL
jgi:hypothetical protein